MPYRSALSVGSSCCSRPRGDARLTLLRVIAQWTPVSYWAVQRLFSTFPNSWPGLGLLILRFATGLSLAVVAYAGDLAGTAALLARCAAGGVAVLIWIGLWTPLAAAVGAAIQVIVITIGHRFELSLVVGPVLGLSLAMLGPGAWSFDARLFGRKRIM
jgi:putative oxidoreductase